MRFTEGQDIDNLNPILTTQILVSDLSTLTAGYFFLYDQRDELVPWLCVEVPTQANHLISADGKTLVYKLRRNVVWQDGVPFTANDVAFSVRTILDPKVNTASTVGFDHIARLETPDPYTVVVHLKMPDASFVSRFLTPGVGSAVLPKHLLEGRDVNHAAYNGLPVGIGPFKYVRWTRGSSVELEAFDRWWGGPPKLRKIVYEIIPDFNAAFNQLHAHDLDVVGRFPNNLIPPAKTIAQTNTLDFDETAYEHIDFNLTHPPLDDVRVRRALAHAIDPAAIVAKVDHGSGYLSCTMIPHFSWAYDDHAPCYSFDLAMASRLLDEAGWPRGPDGVRRHGGRPLRLTLVSTIGNLSRDQSAILIQSWFKAIGVDLSYRRYQANQLFAKRTGILDSGNFDLGLFAWYWSPDPNIRDLYACDQAPPHGQNESRYCNHAVDGLLDDALTHYDRTRRRADYVRAQDLIATDMPSFVLYQSVGHTLARDDFHHLDPGPIQLFSHPAALSRGRS